MYERFRSYSVFASGILAAISLRERGEIWKSAAAVLIGCLVGALVGEKRVHRSTGQGDGG